MSLSGSTASTASIREQQQRVSLSLEPVYHSFNSADNCDKAIQKYLFHSLTTLSLQLPAWWIVATATVVVAASAGCFGFLGHDVGCNVLHFLSLLVQGKLLAVLGFAFLCRDSA